MGPRISLPTGSQRRAKVGLLVVILLGLAAGPVAGNSEEVAGFCWPAGFFYRLGRLNQAAREEVLRQIELRLEALRRHRGLLVVKGEVVGTLSPAVQILPVVTILDQSGLLVQVRRFPNLFFGRPEGMGRLNRSTFLVAQNPRLDVLESRIRQHWVVTADFVAFSRQYLEALGAAWSEPRQPLP